MSTMFADTLLIVFISVCTALLAEGEPRRARGSSWERGGGAVKRGSVAQGRLKLLTERTAGNRPTNSAELWCKALGVGIIPSRREDERGPSGFLR